MRFHKPINKYDEKFLSQEKIQRLSSYNTGDYRKKISVDTKNKGRPEAAEVVERRSNSTKFKSLNDYLSQKYKT
jgi:hypothetical protein